MAKQVEEKTPVLAEDISPISSTKTLVELRELVLDKLNTPQPNITLIRNNLDKIEAIIDSMVSVAPKYARSPGIMTLKICLWEIGKELLTIQERETFFLQSGLETLKTIDALNIVPDTLIDLTPLQSEEQTQMSIAQKDEKPQLAKSEEVDLESLSLVSNVGEEVPVEVLGGYEDVLVHYE